MRSVQNREINVFLLIGQSNMAGRGRLDDVADISHPDVLMFREGRWSPAKEPLHTDKPATAGVGLGMSFAVELMARRAMKPIGLVPCAVGGTPLSRWMPGGDLYENAVSVVQCALRDGGVLKGILWHQGEKDSVNADDANSYGQRLQQMIGRLRKELMAEHVPVVAGELGPFLTNRPQCNFFGIVNQHLWGCVEQLPAFTCVSAAGLTDNGDALHFNSTSLREFGRRYADAYLAI